MMRINILIKSVIILFIFLTGHSCGKYLDIDPAQQINADDAFKTATDVQLALISLYEGIKGTEGGNEGGELFGGSFNFFSELIAADGDVVWNGTFQAQKEMFNKEMTTTNSMVEETWIRGYEVINIVNIILSKLDLVTDLEERDRIEGETKCIRGIIYFEFVRLWGLPFEAGQANDQPGVPVVLTPVTTIQEVTYPVRESVMDVYKQAISDLSEAETLLTASGKNGNYISTYAASAVLSRLYLQTDSFSLAAQKADRVIRSGLYSLADDPVLAYNNTANIPEDIFAIQQSATSNYGENNSGLATHYASLSGQGRGDININPEFFRNFSVNDRRGQTQETDPDRETNITDIFEMYYIGVGSNISGLIQSAKYGDSRLNFPVIRLAEMYLNRTEANFEGGTSIGAPYHADINRVRVRSGLPVLAPVFVTRELIRKERYLELCWEGFRLHDMKRWKQDIAGFDYNSGNLILPIPEREMEANPDNMVQNDYYDK